LGYSRWISEAAGVRAQVTVFVPPGDATLITDIQVTNLLDASVDVDAVPVVEYTHPDALKQFTNADWVPQTMQSRAFPQPGGRLVLVQYPFMFRDIKINYFTANLPASSFETDRSRFLGDHEYGSWAKPLSLEQPELGSYEANRGDNIAALLVRLGSLQPGETRRLVTQLGQEASLEAALPGMVRFHDPAAVDAALDSLAGFWQAYLSRLQVDTPDPAMNSMLNVHNPRQCYITKNWSRYLSLYQLGLGGARGIGFRDSSQDVLAVLPFIPGEAQELVRKLLSVQRQDGSAMHQFNPLTMIGSEGDSLEREDRPHYYSDDHLWIVLAVCEYLKETGDYPFLDEVIPFYEKDKHDQPHESGSVLEHLRRAVDFTKNDTGKHGLPLLGFADWNDTINLPTGAESLFTANLYGCALRELVELRRFQGDLAEVQALQADYETMKRRVNALAWDGDWYVRYFDADGTPLGTHANTYGQIYINSQTWAVLSGFAEGERGRRAMDAVRQRLNTANGIKLSAPGFNGFDPAKGGVTTYPPGAKENGGIFLHTNPWAMIAETILGRGGQAYEYYRQINPAGKNEHIDEFEAEPYVYPQNMLGDEHPQFGLGRNSWLSGTASWAYQAGTKYILGIRPEHGGLRIQPCLPADWDGFSAVRVFRGATYHITVRRAAAGGSAGVVVDGRQTADRLIPVFPAGTEHTVDVALKDEG
jgi:cellobiose phosphorylase